MTTHKPSIAFIGAGNMASSIIGGLIADNYDPAQIWATSPVPELANLRKTFNINISQQNVVAAAKADILVFAVKPSILKTVVTELKEIIISHKPLLISLVTGARIATIVNWLENAKVGIVRCMPNTPALVRCGTTALYANLYVTEVQRIIAESIMRAVGVVLWVENEGDLDTVTAVSGSGPAYFFLMMEAMLQSARKMGLSYENAQLLTLNTALGAARMAIESQQDVEALRQQVTSPGGTTERAIRVFESGGIRSLFDEALQAARARAIEIAESLSGKE
jgi:pyrroline-5-carboxylate reductase